MSISDIIKRRVLPELDTSIEKNILTAMILSGSFCRDVLPMYDSNYFVMEYGSIIADWCGRFYQKYEDAPKNHIKDIFLEEKENLTPEKAKIIEIFLSDLSKKYQYEEEEINEKYVLKKTKKYFKKRSLELLTKNISNLIKRNKIDEAEDILLSFHKVDIVSGSWDDPFDTKIINKTLAEDNDQYILKYPGTIGNVIGGLKRSWLLAFMGPPKRGKTAQLQELAIQGILSKRKVVYFSLEMSSAETSLRFYKRITGLANKGKGGIYTYPVFDCQKNRDGSCRKKQRKNKMVLTNSNGELPPFDVNSKYRVCSYCRDNKIDGFIPVVWFVSEKRLDMTTQRAMNKINKFKKIYGNNLRTKTYPSYSANIGTIKRDLDILEIYDNFIPDIIVIDYADILAPEGISRVNSERGVIDQTWKMLKNLASERDCLVVTASQSNRASIEKKRIKQTDIAEDIRKIAHVDLMLSINQTPSEKEQNLIRLGIIAHRHKEYSELKTVTVLQQLSMGQSLLDSEYIITKETSKKEN